LNVQGFFSPLRDFIHNAINAGFIRSGNEAFTVFLDDPGELGWGEAALQAMDEWHSRGSIGAPMKLQWATAT
jgi:hypothetical protein